MLAPDADRAAAPAAKPVPPVTPGGGPHINPATGLSTDYLNHFAEVIMVLEMASTMPECLNELRQWKPKTYAEHFATSSFSNRDAVVAAYREAQPAVRDTLDEASGALNDALLKTREIVLRSRSKPDAAKAATHALKWLKPQVCRIAAIINGTAQEIAERQGQQAAIDAMFTR